MKTFIQNNKRKLLLILVAIMIVCTFSGFMLTASAFTLADDWTVTYRTNGTATVYETTEDLDTVTAYTVKGTVDDYGIALNGQVYGNANVASTLTANKLYLANVGEGEDGGGYHESYYIYYKSSTDTYFKRVDTHTSTNVSGKTVLAYPLILTEAGTYTICAVSCSYYDEAGDIEETYQRSAFLTVTVNPDFTLPEDPTKTGYTFTGWYIDQACTTKFESDTITSDLVLYAGWTANSYTVIFNANGGTGTMANQAFVYDVSQALSTNQFTRTGYSFEGWALASGSPTVKYTDGESVKNLASIDGAPVTLYAVWSPESYVVKFNANGGTGTMADQTIEYDASTQLSTCTFTREGYIFKGWATSPDGDVVHTDGHLVINLSSDPETPVNLYAVWEIIQCHVTFVVDGKVYAVVTVDYGTPTEEVIADVVNAALYNVGDEELPLE